MIARFLIDTSAAAGTRLGAVADRLEPLITGGLVATCATLDAEALYSARSPGESERRRAAAVLAAGHGMTVVHCDADFEIAAEVLDFEHRWVLPRGTV